MVAGNARTTGAVNLGANGSAHRNTAGKHLHLVRYQALFGSLGVYHLEHCLVAHQMAGVSNLATHLGIERGDVQDDLGLVASSNLGNAGAVLHQSGDLGIGGKARIADEFGSTQFFQQLGVDAAVGAPSGLGVFDVCGAGTFALLFHAAGELFLVDAETALFADLLGDLHRETVGIVQDEGGGAGKHAALKFGKRFVKVRLALTKGGAEALFLGVYRALDKLFVLHELGVHIAHELDDLVDVVLQERALDAKGMPLHNRTAKQAAQDVAAAFVGGQDAVGDHERHRTAMIGHDAKAGVQRAALAVLLAAQGFAHGHQAAQHVRVVVVGNALHDGRDALKAHAGIDVLGLQRRQRAVFLTVVLSEHAIPVLKITVAVAAGLAVGAAAANLGALVEVDLGARAARAGGAGAPEVVFLAQLGDMALGNAQALPDLDGLVVVLEHGEVELFGGQAQNLSRELVGPCAHLALEVLAEAEVAQHLEEAEVTGIADVLDVVGAHALLNRGGSDIALVQLFLMKEIGLELHHAGTGKKQRGIVGDERRGRHALAALFLEELQVLLTDFSSSHVLHAVVVLFGLRVSALMQKPILSFSLVQTMVRYVGSRKATRCIDQRIGFAL